MQQRLAAIAIVAAGVVAVALILHAQFCPQPALRAESVAASNGVLDPTGYIDAADRPRFEHYLQWIRDESDIDIRLVFDRPPAGTTTDEAALALLERLGVGRGTNGQRGLLLYFDLAARRLKVEVGYGLESHFPDAFVAWLVGRHAPLFFDSDNRSLGLRQLLRLLQTRMREAALGGAFDPRVLQAGSTGPLAGGAGAGTDLRDVARAAVPVSGAAQAHAAGATPAATFAAYLRLMAGTGWAPDADLFTEETRGYLMRFPMSAAYRDHILLEAYGRRWTIDTRGDLALLVFTDTPFASPYFLVRQGGVWRIDLMAAIRNTKERVGGPLTWSYEGSDDDPYTRTFGDRITVVQGYRRIADGDNRPLPMRAAAARNDAPR